MSENRNTINKTRLNKTIDKDITARFPWKFWQIFFGFWTAVCAFLTLQFYLFAAANPSAVAGINVHKAALSSFPIFYLWLIFTPAIFWLGRRFSFEQGNYIRIALIHFVLSVIVAAIYLLITSGILMVYVRERGVDAIYPNFVLRFNELAHFEVIIYWSILGAGFALDFYNKYRVREADAISLALRSQELEMQLVQSRLDSLRAQLQPHFLFNTLHAISALIKDAPAVARDMLADLSELLRYALEASETETISLKREIEIAQIYLGIEQQRFNERLEAVFVVDGGDLDVSVPSFLLQPILENSIKYGLSKDGSSAKIIVTAKRLDEGFELSVEDDGRGFPKKMLLGEDFGIGLKNTNARLKQLYGERYEFILENSDRNGAVVRVRIPFEKTEEL